METENMQDVYIEDYNITAFVQKVFCKSSVYLEEDDQRFQLTICVPEKTYTRTIVNLGMQWLEKELFVQLWKINSKYIEIVVKGIE